MNFKGENKKSESMRFDREAEIAELETREREIFAEMQSCRVAVNELMERIERLSPEERNTDISESYSNVLDAAVTRFYNAEQEWIKAVNEILIASSKKTKEEAGN